ncbi:MAG: PAS domain S-box protein [Sphaerochaeta sp.]
MHRRHRLPTLLLLSLLALSTALFGQQLPDVTSAIEHAINPIVLIDGDSGELLLANPSARRFFADDGPVSLDTLFSLTSGPVTDLHGTVVTLGDPPTHQMVSVIHVGGAPHSYFVIMLTNWDDQQRLMLRNRLLLTLLITLLTVCLIVFFILLRTQATLLKRFRQHQRRQESTVALFQQFLDNDPRLSYVRDSEGEVIFANRTFKEHFGTPPLGRSAVTSLVCPEVIEESFDENRNVLETGEAVDAIRHHKGRIVRVIKFPVTLPDERPGIGALVSDITDEKQVEEILRENLRRSALLVEMLSSVHTDDQAHADRGLELACTLTDSSAALLLLYNEREGVLSIASSCRLHTPPTELSRATTAYLLDRTAGGRALIENGDTEANPLASVMGSKLESLLTVPFYADEVLGGIVLLSDSKGGYDEQDGYQVQLLFSSLYTAALKSQRDRELQESRASLRLILDSTAEGIFGIDESGTLHVRQCKLPQVVGVHR